MRYGIAVMCIKEENFYWVFAFVIWNFDVVDDRRKMGPGAEQQQLLQLLMEGRE